MNLKKSKSKNEMIYFDQFSFYYGENQVLFDINLKIPRNKVIAFIGPSGCGKSTLLRSVNRMNDLIDHVNHQGDITIEGESVYHHKLDISFLRKRVGMVFQKSNPFPKSIYENIIFSLKMSGFNKKSFLDEVVEMSLKKAFLWKEVKDRLHKSALSLSGGQMQRLCIARAIANSPEVLLMDEPCSALDPIATDKIEDLVQELRKEFTIVIVTHNLQQASRISDQTAFFYLGKLIEYSETKKMFINPENKKTEDYITGKFG